MSNEIEDIFKQKFDNFTSAPSEGLFDAIMAKRAKKRRAIWIWSAVALLFTIGSFTLYNVDKADSSNLSQLSQTNAVADPLESEEAQNNLGLEPQDENEVSNSSSNNNVPLELNPSSIKQSDEFQYQKVENKVVVAEESPLIGESNKQVSSKENNSDGENLETKNDLGDNRTQIFAKLFAELEATSNPSSDGITMYIKDAEYQIDEIPNQDETNSKNEAEDEVIDDKVSSVDTSSTKDPNTSVVQSPNKANLITGPNELGKWRVELTTGLGMAGRSLSGNQAYITQRNSSENAQISYGFDLRAGYQFTPKWNLQMGINATMRNENFVYQLPNSIVTTTRIENREETIIHPVFGVIKRNYEVEITETEEIVGEKTTSENRFTQITLPLELEGSLFRSNDVSVLIKGGILLGINSKGDGQMLTEEGLVSAIQELEYKKSGIHSMNFGLGLGYDINPKTTLLFYPQARYALGSAFKNAATFEQREFGIYSHIGLRIKL